MPAGKTLIAHELVHTRQQGGVQRKVQRVIDGTETKELWWGETSGYASFRKEPDDEKGFIATLPNGTQLSVTARINKGKYNPQSGWLRVVINDEESEYHGQTGYISSELVVAKDSSKERKSEDEINLLAAYIKQLKKEEEQEEFERNNTPTKYLYVPPIDADEDTAITTEIEYADEAKQDGDKNSGG